ncbi:MAG: hypothetical protein AAB263_13245 [Planctomycetota bacterium]
MQFLTTSELRNPDAWQSAHAEKSVVTNHGKPIVIMLPVTAADFEDTLDLVSQVEAMRAMLRIQRTAQRNGTSNLTLDEIDAEISLSRKERKGRKKVQGKSRASRRS